MDAHGILRALMPVTLQQPLDRQNLASRVEAVLNRGGWGNPDVLLVRDGDGHVVVKDYAPRSAWVRALIGPIVISREMRAIERLADHPLVPALLQKIDRLAFAMEYRPGARMDIDLVGKIPTGFVRELAHGVATMHEMGVTHQDLRNRGNVLAGEDGHPVLLDFASALRFRKNGIAYRWLLPVIRRADLGAVEKWRQLLRGNEVRDTKSPASGSR